MKTAIFVIALIAISALFIAGCTSQNQGTGYATYSGNAQQPSGGGGCGRFDAGTINQPVIQEPVVSL